MDQEFVLLCESMKRNCLILSLKGHHFRWGEFPCPANWGTHVSQVGGCRGSPAGRLPSLSVHLIGHRGSYPMRVLGTWLSFRIANGTPRARERTKAVSFPGGGDIWGGGSWDSCRDTGWLRKKEKRFLVRSWMAHLSLVPDPQRNYPKSLSTMIFSWNIKKSL